MGQVGTKHGAISPNQEQCLTNVGEAYILTEQDSISKVLGTCTRSNTTAETNGAPFWCISCHRHATAERLEPMWGAVRNTLSYTIALLMSEA